MIRKSILIAMASMVLSVGSAASAGGPYGVFNGVTLTWVGVSANTNQISTYWGSVANGGWNSGSGWFQDLNQENIITVTKGGYTQSTNFKFDVNITAQAASTCYYLYNMRYGSPQATEYVISLIPPFPDGYPLAAVSWKEGTTQYNLQTGTFLGSYVTDANGDIIPFERIGDEVILTPVVNQVSFDTAKVFADKAGGVLSADFSSTSGTKTLTFGAGGNAVTPLPQSASAMIADVTGISGSGTVSNLVTFLAPKLNSAASAYSQASFPVLAGGTSGTTGQPTWVRLRLQFRAGTNKVDPILDVYSASTGPFVVVTYRGYVEHIQQMSTPTSPWE